MSNAQPAAATRGIASAFGQDVADAQDRVHQIKAEVKAGRIERDEYVDALFDGIVSRQHVFVLGPTGAAKSDTLLDAARRVEVAGSGHSAFFVAQMHQQMTLDELVGLWNFGELKHNNRYVRVTDGMLPRARFAFLDEIDKASPSTVNGLLQMINERKFKNGATFEDIPLDTVVMASNREITEDELRPFFDRVPIRVVVEYVSEDRYRSLLRLAVERRKLRRVAAVPTTVTEEQLTLLQDAACEIELPSEVEDALDALFREMAQRGLRQSDRKPFQFLPVLQARAIIEGRAEVDLDDLEVLRHILWESTDKRQEVARLVSKHANPPFLAEILEAADKAQSVYEGWQKTIDDQAVGGPQKIDATREALDQLNAIDSGVEAWVQKLPAAEQKNSRLEKIRRRMEEMRNDVAMRGFRIKLR